MFISTKAPLNFVQLCQLSLIQTSPLIGSRTTLSLGKVFSISATTGEQEISSLALQCDSINPWTPPKPYHTITLSPIPPSAPASASARTAMILTQPSNIVIHVTDTQGFTSHAPPVTITEPLALRRTERLIILQAASVRGLEFGAGGTVALDDVVVVADCCCCGC